MFSMFQISCWYNKGNDDKIKLEHIAIMCSNCEKKQGDYVFVFGIHIHR